MEAMPDTVATAAETKTNRAERRRRQPAPRPIVARWRKGFPSIKRATRKAERMLAGSRVVDTGLTPLDPLFGVHSPMYLLLFSSGRPDFDPNERARRRARNKRARASRSANRR
jgi:hypothetical protein